MVHDEETSTKIDLECNINWICTLGTSLFMSVNV